MTSRLTKPIRFQRQTGASMPPLTPPGRMHAGWTYFVSFQRAAEDFARFARTKLTMPVLSIGGAQANGDALGKQVKLVAVNAESIVLPNTGHWLMEERPLETMDALIRFIGSPSGSKRALGLPEMRMTPNEVRTNQTGTENIGSSLLGVSARKCCSATHRNRDSTRSFCRCHQTPPSRLMPTATIALRRSYQEHGNSDTETISANRR